MTKQQYVCDAVYSPLANAIADCQICGWEISRHKMVDSTAKGPFGPHVALTSNIEPDAWMLSINPKLVTAHKAETEWWHKPGIPLYRALPSDPKMKALLDEALEILAIALPGPRPWPIEDIDAKLRIYRNMAEDRRRAV